MLREPSVATGAERDIAAPPLAQVFLRYSASIAFSPLPDALQAPIVVSWHMTKTISASVPARSAIAAAGKAWPDGSARCVDGGSASSARSIWRYAGPVAIPTVWAGRAGKAAGSMSGAEAPQRH